MASAPRPYVPTRYRQDNVLLGIFWPGSSFQRVDEAPQCDRLCVNVTDLAAQSLLFQPHVNDLELAVVVTRALEQLLSLVRPEALVVTWDGVLPLQALARLRHDFCHMTAAEVARQLPLLAGSRPAVKLQTAVVRWLQEQVAKDVAVTVISQAVPGDGLCKLRTHLRRHRNAPGEFARGTLLYGRTNAHVLSAWLAGVDLVYISYAHGVWHMPAPQADLAYFRSLVMYDLTLLPCPPRLLQVDPTRHTLAYIDELLAPAALGAPRGPPHDPAGEEADSATVATLRRRTQLYALAVQNAVTYYASAMANPTILYPFVEAPAAPFELLTEAARGAVPLTTVPPLAAHALVLPRHHDGAFGSAVHAATGPEVEGEDSLHLPLALLQEDGRTFPVVIQQDDLPAERLLVCSEVDRVKSMDNAMVDSVAMALAVDGQLTDLLRGAEAQLV